MTEKEMKDRLKQFALRILSVAEALPKSVSGRTVANQLARSGTSVAANYRAACRGRSPAEFIAKLGTVEEEADESAFWLEIIMEKKLLPPTRIKRLHTEASEIVAMMVSSRKSTSSNLKRTGKTIKTRQSKIKNPRSDS